MYKPNSVTLANTGNIAASLLDIDSSCSPDSCMKKINKTKKKVKQTPLTKTTGNLSLLRLSRSCKRSTEKNLARLEFHWWYYILNAHFM